MKPVVIGFLGTAGAGKTPAAKFLEEKYGAVRISFAYPLKRMAMDMFGFTEEQVWGSTESKEAVDPNWGVSPRELMMRLGHSARERINKSVWVDVCLNQVTADYRLYVIDDVRYVNEVAAITDSDNFDGYIIKLVCPDSISDVSNSTHSSETEIYSVPDQFLTATVTCCRSPDSHLLRKSVDEVVGMILDQEQV